MANIHIKAIEGDTDDLGHIYSLSFNESAVMIHLNGNVVVRSWVHWRCK